MTQFLDNGIYDAQGWPSRKFAVRGILFMLALLAVSLTLLTGCSSTPTGVRVVASSATATKLGDINWDEYKIPVFSVYTGPKTTIWINRDYLALSRVTAGGCVTNDTSALGVYSSKEQKRTRVEIEFAPVSADGAACPVAGAQASADAAQEAE